MNIYANLNPDSHSWELSIAGMMTTLLPAGDHDYAIVLSHDGFLRVVEQYRQDDERTIFEWFCS